MNLKRALFVVIFILQSISLISQRIDTKYTRTAEDEERVKLFRNNFFRQRGISIFSDFVSFPGLVEETEIKDGTRTVYEDWQQVRFASLFSYTYEFRYNILNFRDYFSISASSPLSVGFYGGFQDTRTFIGFRVPLCVDANFFLHSTFNNINRVGFYFGAGVLPYITIGPVDLPLQQFVRVGLKYPYRSKMTYLEFSIGRGAVEEYKGEALRSSSFKITLGRILKL